MAEQLLLAVKQHQDTQLLQTAMATASPEALQTDLPDDTAKKAFWINVYNAWIQILLRQQPQAYQHKTRFFAKRQIPLCGLLFSFNQIEHGLLRRSAFWWSLGYLHHPFPSVFERSHRLAQKDHRIHFALNCGAKSCPPVAFYQPDELEQQLEMATANFLEQTTQYDAAKHQVTVSKLLLWFQGDFGGKKGVGKLLRKWQLIPNNDPQPRFFYAAYDWQLALEA
jgi:hypothetical protein